MPQAEIADLVQSLGQDLHQEAAQELVTGDATCAPAVRFGRFVAQDNAIIINPGGAAVGRGSAEHIAGQVVENGLLACPHDVQ